jgi:hypothetical protein
MERITAWARANPLWSRTVLRLGLRILLLLAIVPTAQSLGASFGLDGNIAAILAVVAAMILGGKLADRAAELLAIPEPPR